MFVPYTSFRPLAGLGSSDTSNYANYARAIYQAINGDVSGGAYNAAIAYAGPIAAIGNAVANFLNKSGDIKSAATQAMIDAFQQADIIKLIEPRTQTYLVAGRCTAVRATEEARELSEAIRKQASPEEVKRLFLAWIATGKPFTPTGIYSSLSKWCEPLPPPTYESSSPAPVPSPVPNLSPVPVMPVSVPANPPTAVLPPGAPPEVSTPLVLPATPSTPPITVNVPASVAPDDTPILIQQLIAQGASQQQAMIAALSSLARRGVPASLPVQTRVARDIQRASLLPASSSLLVIAGVALFGFSYLVSRN